jgi:hypothetical protein
MAACYEYSAGEFGGYPFCEMVTIFLANTYFNRQEEEYLGLQA